jgi:regulator of sigma E protease
MHLLTYPALATLLASPNFGQWAKAAVIDIAAVAFVLGVLVFVHEFGHYAVAKLFRVRVEVFSLGFGKRLWGFRRGDTDYRISVLPLGGYVKMSGENPMEERTGDPGEFTSHPRWQRFLIAIAGPAMNIILAIALLTGLNMLRHGYEAYSKAPVDVFTITPNSPAAKAGIQPGDRIIKVQDVQNPTWKQFQEALLIPESLALTIQRGEQTLKPMTVVPEPTGPENSGNIGIVHPEIVGDPAPGPATEAGVKEGDILVSVDGAPFKSIEDMLNGLQKSKDKPIVLTILRNGKETKLSVTPRILPEFSDHKYRIGLGTTKFEQLPFQAALAAAYVECKENSTLIFKLLGKLVQSPKMIQQVSGPLGIAQVSGQAARIGFSALLFVMALISLNLAVLNLLPIPILDGGLMLMLLVEGTMRRDIKLEIKERVYQAAFVFLILFFAVVIVSDVLKSFHS